MNYNEGIQKVVSPENSVLSLLTYRHIVVTKKKSIEITTGAEEGACIVLKGNGAFQINGDVHTVQELDTLYLTKEESCLVSTEADGKFELLLF